jgi:hypothetical protein
MTPARLLRAIAGFKAAAGFLAAECAAHELEDLRAWSIGVIDETDVRFRGVDTRISHTRRMRVPLPPALRVIDGGE